MKNRKSSAALPKTKVVGTTSHDHCSLTSEKLMNTQEAADFLGIPVNSVHNLTSQGKLPYYKFGSRNRYSRYELNQLLLRNRKGGVGYGY